LSIRIIPSGLNILDEIITHLIKKERDYSSNMVIFPGKRPSHFLRRALAREVGSSLIPPLILSMDDFIDFIYGRSFSGRKIENIDAVSILYEIHRKAKNPIGRDGFMTPDSFFPIGLKIYRDLEELQIEGIKSSQVKEIQPFTDEVIPGQTLLRLQSLSFFYEAFYRIIGKHDLSTRSSRYSTVAEKITDSDVSHFQRIVFAGFFAPTKSEKDLFRKMSSFDNVLFIYQDGPGIRKKIENPGISINQKTDDTPEPEISFYSSPDAHGQVYALSSILNTKKTVAGEDTVIVLPSSETLFPLLRQGIGDIDPRNYNVSMGYPLHRTPIFGFLNNLMELITSMEGARVYIPDYLKFVLHPYTKNIYWKGSTEITRIIFHTVEEELTKKRARTFSTLQDIEKDERLLDHIMDKMPREERDITRKSMSLHLEKIHRNTIGKFLAFMDVKDFAVKCIDLLTYLFNESTARLHPLFYPFSEAFIITLDSISRSLMKDVAFAERPGYFTFFRKYIMTCHAPFEGTPLRGLQILGFLETRNLKFGKVIILDANEGVMPDTRKEDSLLPFKAREILGLPTYMERDELAAYYFETLIRGSKEVHLCFIENDKQERSRFVEKLLWEKQKKYKNTSADIYLNSVQYKVRLKNREPDDVIKTEGIAGYLRSMTFSATAIDKYLRCPLQFYYSYVLRLGKKDEISGDIERSDIGKFVHKIISHFFSNRRGFVLKEKDMKVRAMDILTDRLFEQEYGKKPFGAVYLLKKQIKDHLNDLLDKYYIPLLRKEPLTVLDNEKDIAVSMDSFCLKGRLDSIEKRGEKIYIIDYKTSANPDYLKIRLDKLKPDERGSWSEAIGSLQLPFYLLLYSQYAGVKINNLNGMFLLVGQSFISEKIELPLFENQEAEQVFGILKGIIFRLLGEIVDISIPFTASVNKKNACPNCDFQYICGTQWITK
jgi:ATP-dependent helicase/nuclease subunit B